jgi:hypothetical protein
MTNDITTTLGSTLQTLVGFGTPPVLEATAPSAGVRGRGRPSYELEDAPLCAEIVQRHEAGDFRSIEAAARAMWPLAAGYGSSDSKAERIAKRSRDRRRLGP